MPKRNTTKDYRILMDNNTLQMVLGNEERSKRFSRTFKNAYKVHPFEIAHSPLLTLESLGVRRREDVKKGLWKPIFSTAVETRKSFETSFEHALTFFKNKKECSRSYLLSRLEHQIENTSFLLKGYFKNCEEYLSQENVTYLHEQLAFDSLQEIEELQNIENFHHLAGSFIQYRMHKRKELPIMRSAMKAVLNNWKERNAKEAKILGEYDYDSNFDLYDAYLIQSLITGALRSNTKEYHPVIVVSNELSVRAKERLGVGIDAIKMVEKVLQEIQSDIESNWKIKLYNPGFYCFTRQNGVVIKHESFRVKNIGNKLKK